MALSHVMNLVSNSGLVGAAGGSGGGGGGGDLDSQAVTTGSHSVFFPGGSGLPANTGYYEGFFNYSSTRYGSISDGTSNLYSGAAIEELYYTWNNVYFINLFTLEIAGTSRANSGWTTLTVNGTSYLRTNASYNANSGGNTRWTWSAPGGSDNTGANNPFPATGQVATCAFT